MRIRFEDHPTRTAWPPREVRPMLMADERVISIETVTDAGGHASARVWIAQDEDEK